MTFMFVGFIIGWFGARMDIKSYRLLVFGSSIIIGIKSGLDSDNVLFGTMMGISWLTIFALIRYAFKGVLVIFSEADAQD